LSIVAEMVATPALTPVTTPAFTVAIAALAVFQVTARPVIGTPAALSAVADREVVAPTITCAVVGATDTVTTTTGGGGLAASVPPPHDVIAIHAAKGSAARATVLVLLWFFRLVTWRRRSWVPALARTADALRAWPGMQWA
jgi:hypothetical protein